MERTKVFKNGGSLAVRLPKKYALPVGDVMIDERDGVLVLIPVDDKGWPADLEKWFSPDVGDWEVPTRPKDSRALDL